MKPTELAVPIPACLDCRDTEDTARKLGWNELPDSDPDAHGDAGAWLGRELNAARTDFIHERKRADSLAISYRSVQAETERAVDLRFTLETVNRWYAIATHDLCSIRAYLEAFATGNASDEMDALTDADQDRMAAYVRALTTPYIEQADELQAMIDNERGDGEPPSPGWEWSNATNGWTRVDDTDKPECPDERTVMRVSGVANPTRRGVEYPPVWRFLLNGEECVDMEQDYPTARSAMRAADIERIAPKD